MPFDSMPSSYFNLSCPRLTGKSGYKTLGVAISPSMHVIKDSDEEEKMAEGEYDDALVIQRRNGGNGQQENNGIRMKFIGILPMLGQSVILTSSHFSTS